MEQLEQEIAEWHRKTFPDATIHDYLDKCQEETNEFFVESFRPFTRDYWNELADLVITHIVLAQRSSGGSLEGLIRRKFEEAKARYLPDVDC